jgi:hypothetical protein
MALWIYECNVLPSACISSAGLWSVPGDLYTTSRTALRPTQPLIQWVKRAPSVGVKRPRRETNHSPPYNADVKEWVELYFHSPSKPSWRGAQLKRSTWSLISSHFYNKNFNLERNRFSYKWLSLFRVCLTLLTSYTFNRRWTEPDSWDSIPGGAGMLLHTTAWRLALGTPLFLSNRSRVLISGM